jgi:hypothetical protein
VLLASARKSSRRTALTVERLEDRFVPSTFLVQNLHDGGAGSLRQAILAANATPGADVIDFSVAGTIHLTSGALPAITHPLSIDGTTAPGFAAAPVVEVDYNHFAGLVFGAGASGSSLLWLALVNAADNGVTLNGGGNTVIAGNYIGLQLDGTTPSGNACNGVVINLGSSGNTIGGTSAQDRNVISANGGNGIWIGASSGNLVVGNYIGTDATGALKRGNSANGVAVVMGASGNVIGGTPNNVISANGYNGVLINTNATQTTVNGNLIGLAASGTAALGNYFDGVRVDGSSNNVIGNNNPVTGVTYNNADSVGVPVSGWQGIRGADASGDYLISGTSGVNGLLYDGPITGTGGTTYSVNYPDAYTTSVYGPNNLGNGTLQLVGTYKNSDYATAPVTVNGFIFQGGTGDLANPADYQTIDYPGAKYNYVHSTMGGLAVGNYDSPTDDLQYTLPLAPGHAYVYDVANSTFLTDVVYPGSKSNTAYGIWYNGGTSYTICGGYSLDPVNNLSDQDQPIGHAYLVDYDSATGQFSNWASFDYPYGTNFVTHFEGISSVEKGVYTLNADSLQVGSSNPTQGSWVTVRRNADGSFGPATWVNLNYTGVDPTTNITSSNSVYGNQVVGIVIGPAGPFSFQATVNVGFQLSNVISANRGNGIDLFAANNNQVAMNYVGTDASGTLARGNAGNGIMVTAGASGNVIGGQATGGNDPTNGVFVRPPLGNLISGNAADGVLLNGAATGTSLSGNYIGTAASGDAALGNGLDGVGIVNANGNSLVGCTVQQDPFVFYNVIGGNGGNGLRVTSSNNTTIQANFFGVGADNNTAVGNGLNGVVVEGSSAGTAMGGPIPLGNVDAANNLNGLVVRDQASNFTSYNTFCGLAAFSTNPNLGNGQDGMLITSTGGNILIRTNVITRNGNDGIEIGGAASGVRVAGNIIGLDTQGNAAMGNVRNGVEVDGLAHGIVIGGPQATFDIIPHNAISANGGYGVAVVGGAHDVQISYSDIGTDLLGDDQYGNVFGNGKAGVLLGPGTYSTTIGSADPTLPTVISGNKGNGIEMRGSWANTVVGCLIGTDAVGVGALPNGANGIYLSNSSNNLIGQISAGVSGSPANLIAFNTGDGVLVASGNENGIRENSIYGNTLLGIELGPWANAALAPPVLTSVLGLPLGTRVSGSVVGQANTVLTIEFFANTTNAASGRTYLGSMKVQTNAAGVATFTFSGPVLPAGSPFITATATDFRYNTSEFSAAVSPVV